MAGIEFVESGADAGAEPFDAAAVSPAASAERFARLVPALWALAAAVCVIAPFQSVYRLSLHTFGFSETQEADGWGRVRYNPLPFAQHEPRYGLVLCVAGVAFVVAALLARYRPRLTLLRVFVGIAGAGLAVGVIASALLAAQSARDNIDAQLGSPVNDQVVQQGPPIPAPTS